MNKKVLTITVLSASLLLAACGGTSSSKDSSSAASSAISSQATSAVSSEPSVAPSSDPSSEAPVSSDSSSEAPASSEATSESSEESLPSSEEISESMESSVDEGPLTLGDYEDDGVTYARPGVSYADGVYTFTVSLTEKTGLTLSGTLDGSINIVTTDDSVKGGAITLELQGVTITASGDTAPIYYGVPTSNVSIKAKKGTTNTLTYTGSKKKIGAIQSENNVELGGKGSLVLISNDNGHGVKADKITLKSAVSIDITAGKNGFNGKDLVDDEYTGKISAAVSGYVFAFDDDDEGENGSIAFPACSVSATCDFVFKADADFTIPSGATIIATATTGFCYNSNTEEPIDITIEGSVTVNGDPVYTQQLF